MEKSQPDLGEVGRRNFTAFVKTTAKLIKDLKEGFDLLVGSGDSGIAMVKFTEFIYDGLGIKSPPSIQIPIFRFRAKDVPEGKSFDNSVLQPMVKRQWPHLNKIKSILFVDDEVGEGFTAKISLQLIIDTIGDQSEELNYFIVAEDQGFIWKWRFPRVRVKFIPFIKHTKGVYNAISYIIPYELEKPIKEIYSEEEFGSKARMDALLGLPIKKLINGKPVWSNEYLGNLKREISNFEDLQNRFEEFSRNLIHQSLPAK